MRDSYLPNENADALSRRRVERSRRKQGVVDSTNEDGTVRVRFNSESHTIANLGQSVPGDDYVPTVGDSVIIQENAGGEDTVVDVINPNADDQRATTEGERVLGHPSSDTNVRYHPDGSLTVTVEDSMQWHFDIDGTATVSIPPMSDPVLTFDDNGIHFADGEVVTDVKTTSSDGYVTSVDPVYTDTLSL